MDSVSCASIARTPSPISLITSSARRPPTSAYAVARFASLALVAGVVTALALIASGAGLIALQKQHEAESQAQLALAAQLRLLTDTAARHLYGWKRFGRAGHYRRCPREPGTPPARSASAIDRVSRKCARADAGLPYSPVMAVPSWAPPSRPTGGASSPPPLTGRRANLGHGHGKAARHPLRP